MNVALRKPMTLAEFLAWEERRELKYEFDGFRPVAMAGGTIAHSRIQRNLALALQSRLRGGPCEFFGSDLKFLTAEETIRYPDGMVVFAPVDDNGKFVSNPTIVFEVLSPSTTETDRIVKAREYEATLPVRRYVMIEQGSRAAVVYARSGEVWTHHILIAESILSLPEFGVEVPLAELYEGLNIAAPDAGEPLAAGAD